MEYTLKVKPKNPVIIQGFPSFGLVGTIATGFLIDHLNAKPIGEIYGKELPAMVAVHNKEIIKPLEIFYAKKENIIIINALLNVAGLEWDIASTILKLARDLKAKEIVVIEGVASPQISEEPLAFYFSTKENQKLKQKGIPKLNEGVIMGVTASMLSLARTTNVNCIFVETHTDLPDSRAAAKAIEVIDKYLGLKVDYKPLIKKAEEFEERIRKIIEKSKKSAEIAKQKQLSYLG